MSIIKFFVLLLFCIIKIDCSPYNHLDLQLAMLILSAGDPNGNILYNPKFKEYKEEVDMLDRNYNIYLTVAIDNSDENNEKSIVDILPVLHEIDQNDRLDDKNRIKNIETTFKDLYMKSQRVVCARLSLKCDNNNLLFDQYKNDPNAMKNNFDTILEDKDIFRMLNDDNVKLINGESDVTTLSLYKSIGDDKKYMFDLNNEKFIEYIFDANIDDLIFYENIETELDSNNNLIKEPIEEEYLNNDIFNEYRIIAKACKNNRECKEMFQTVDGNNIVKDLNVKFNLIKNNESGKYYLSIVKDDKISTFSIHKSGEEYEVEKEQKNNILQTKIKTLKLSDIDNKLKGYGKESRGGGNGFVESKDISLIADCGILVEKDGTVYLPNNYKVNDDRLNSNILNSKVAKKTKIDNFPNTNIRFKQNILSYYYDSRYCSIEEIVKEFIRNRKSIFGDKNKENTIIKRMDRYIKKLEKEIKKCDDEIVKYDGRSKSSIYSVSEQKKALTNKERIEKLKDKLKTKLYKTLVDEDKYSNNIEVTAENSRFELYNYDNNKIQFGIIGDAATLNLLEKLYPVDMNLHPNKQDKYKFNIILNDGAHFTEYEYASQLSNETNKYRISNLHKNCNSKKAKRLEGQVCKLCNNLQTKHDIDIDSPTISTLKMFKDMGLNSNILPFTSNINNINDLKLLYRDARTIDEVWNKIVKTYIDNNNFLNKEQSETFIRNFNDVINNYILIFTNSKYSDKYKSSEEINGIKLNNMLSSYFDAIDAHKNKYNEEIENLELYPFEEFDSKSQYHKEKFREVINKLSNIVGIDPDSIIRSDDPKSAVQNLCAKLSSIDTIDVDLYNELSDLKLNYELELGKNDKSSLNSELANMLYNTVAIKYLVDTDDEDILPSENNLNEINNNINLNNSNNKKSKFEEFTDSVAFMILAAGREKDYKLAREYDENGNLVPISIKISVNGEEKSISIKDIIPSLRNLNDDELEKKFEYLYELSSIYYSENFESYYSEEEKYAIFREHPMDTIRKSNALSHILKAYNIREDGSIEDANLSPNEISIHFSNKNDIDEKFVKFISEVDENELKNININDHEKLSNSFKNYWDETNMDKDMDSLYKSMAIYCVKNSKCRQYIRDNKDKLSFNIASYKTNDRNKEITNHTLIINNDENEETINVFTFKENNGKYEVDETNEYMKYDYKELSSFNIINKPSIIRVDDKEYVLKPGISLLAECEFEFEDSEGNPIKLDQYALANDKYKDLINDYTINEKYETSNKGKYNMNLVDSVIFDINRISNGIEVDNDAESSSMNQINQKLIFKRHQNEANEYGKFDENEIETMDRYSNYILKEELNNEGKGVLHLTDDDESITKYNRVKETMEINNRVKDIKNQQNGCMRNRNSPKCLKTSKVTKAHDVEGSLSKVLNIARKHDDSNNIKIKENEKVDISNPENLSKNSEKLVDTLKTTLDIYKKAVQISRMDKREYIIHLFEVVIGLIERYNKSSYLDHESIRDLNEESLKDMISILNSAVNEHDKKYPNEKLGKVIKIVDSKSIAESNSKFVNDKLHEIYDNIFDLLNDHNIDITNMGFIDNMNIDSKRFNDDRTFELNQLTEILNEFMISGSEKSRQEYKEKLLSIYDKLTEIEQIFDRENSDSNTFVNNSQMVYTLKESVINVLTNNGYLEDGDLQARLKTYKSTINGVNKSEIKSTNVLNLDHIISKVKIDDYILKNSKSTMYVKKYFDELKDRLYDDNGQEEVVGKINDVEKVINEKIESFNNYRTPEGHYEEANHLIELLNNYNELIATALSLDIDIGESNYIYINDITELSERLNHMRLKGFNKVLESLKQESPESFKIDKNKNVKKHFEERNAQGYGFGGVTEYEGRYEDFKAMMKDNIDSEFDAIVLFTDKITNKDQILEIKRSLNMGYKLTLHELSSDRDEEKVNTYNKLTSKRKIFNNLKNSSMKFLETDVQTENRLMGDVVAELHITDLDVEHTELEDIYGYIKGFLPNNRNIKNRSGVKKGLENMCLFKINEGIKYSGITPNESYDKFYNDINDLVDETDSLINTVSPNSESSIKNQKLNGNLKNHNQNANKKYNKGVKRSPSVKSNKIKNGKSP